jgi:hypothetical protein
MWVDRQSDDVKALQSVKQVIRGGALRREKRMLGLPTLNEGRGVIIDSGQ